MERSCCSSSTVLQKGHFIYVEALLQGGAPWGFTLKGGLEHGEALIISKVEEGGKADQLQYPLQPGDQLVNINKVELSGFRQEAISLVKGSYKVLSLTLRRAGYLDLYSGDLDILPSFSPSLNHRHPQESQGCSEGVKLHTRNSVRRRGRTTMDLLGAFYWRKFQKKHKKINLSEGAMCKAPSESSVNSLATGLISKVLSFRVRRREPVSRPHSWHSTKLGESQQDPSMMQISQGTVGTPWHQTYHSSTSTTDLSGYDPGLLRKSPDQYSSRGSMESLDHGHAAYSSCRQLYLSKSSNSIDHLNSKRDSAYSSFSTSSSIPEYPASAGPSFSKERSYSMENMLSQRGPEGLRQADIRYVRTIYDPQQGTSKEHDVSSVALLRNSEGRAHAESCGRGASCRTSSASNRHSIGPVWSQAHGRNSLESLKGAPPPPLRSDSYDAIRNHERPNSWSSLEQARSLRALQKGSRHHSVGSVASGKPLLASEGQLHTVVEKSPESSPTTRPKQSLPQAPAMGCLMLPTGIYPVPPPEPHFAQVPISYPSSSSVYPALAKENEYISQKNQGLNVDRVAMENVYQSSDSSSSSQTLGFPQPNSSSQQMKDREQEHSKTKYGINKFHFKEGNVLPQMSCQEHFHGSVLQDRRDPYTPVQRRGESQKHSQSIENSGKHVRSEEGRILHAEGSHCMETTHLQKSTVFPEGQASFENGQVAFGNHKDQSVQGENRRGTPHTRGQAAPRCHSDSSTWPQSPDHPLTQLENALVDVQRPVCLESDQGEKSRTPMVRLSVLEKVSQFEQREQGKQRSQSAGHSHHGSYSSARLGQAPGTKSTFSVIGCIRSKLNLSDGPNMQALTINKTPHAEGKSVVSPEIYRQQKHNPDTEALQRHRNCDKQDLPRSPQGRAMALQRSKSTFQLSEENGTDFHWRDDLQNILGSIQDTSFNRAYRDSIKEAQSKVLRSTSFRRKDLSVTPIFPCKHLSLERKGPKTLPKPTGISSPHTPKERHVVTPEEIKTVDVEAAPDLSYVPQVGPLPVARIGSRKRLTLEQKKRSYSEPEKMHEVGVSAGESPPHSQKKGPLFFPETSVADKRKLFELAAKKNVSISRPELKQLQQNALAEYVERKTGQRGGGRHRPLSAHFQAVSSDSKSFSPASSIDSLQEQSLHTALLSNNLPEANRASSASHPSSQFHLNRMPAQALGEASSSTHGHTERSQGMYDSEWEFNKTTSNPSEPPSHPRSQTTLCPQQQKQPSKSFERRAPAGRSTSAEDLLERSEERAAPQHTRSRSSPSGQRPSQSSDPASATPNADLVNGDSTLLGMVSREPPPTSQREPRLSEHAKDDQPVDVPQRAEGYILNQDQDQLSTPVVRRERQRNVERQRANSVSGLAASVGFPCPFFPSLSSSGLDWEASDKLCQATLEALTHSSLPFLAHSEEPDPMAQKGPLPDANMVEEAPREDPGPQRPARPKMAVDHRLREIYRDTAHTQSLPSLRISESNLQFDPTPFSLQMDDEVFLPEPTTPIRETDITEDLPTSLSPHLSSDDVVREQSDIHWPAGLECVNSTKVLDDTAICRETETEPSNTPAPSATPDEEEEPHLPVLKDTAHRSLGILEMEYPMFSRRERSAEELRAEVLARELVSRDKSLTPILDNGAVKSTMDLMETLFPMGAMLPRRHRRSQEEDREQDVHPLAGETQLHNPVRETATDLDVEEADLNQKKELVEALTLSLAALRREKDRLAEDQRRNEELGGRMEALVYRHCKPNERDKYRRFVGDVDKVVSLLLSLCWRLARVESSLSTLVTQDMEESTEERESLLQKRRQLCGQRDDARELKENLDHREHVVLDILAGYLSRPQLRDHQHLVRMKPALLIRQRLLDELIREGEEQLFWLGEHLSPDYRPNFTPTPSSVPLAFHAPRPSHRYDPPSPAVIAEEHAQWPKQAPLA
ncbi:hypothetical protein AAFF_G00425710 [Aldrovandia affinis]|uniref:Protein Shroom3 n=1 Tax=Aldrovandia affinis TaxID=143900 RepID=A0AAD7T719_9TELE|nr:hypothetical protein AAFF_G00425710 [Aldrovandia affinis]